MVDFSHAPMNVIIVFVYKWGGFTKNQDCASACLPALSSRAESRVLIGGEVSPEMLTGYSSTVSRRVTSLCGPCVCLCRMSNVESVDYRSSSFLCGDGWGPKSSTILFAQRFCLLCPFKIHSSLVFRFNSGPMFAMVFGGRRWVASYLRFSFKI